VRDGRAAASADNRDVHSLHSQPQAVSVECLRCGHTRPFTPGPWRYEEAGDCPRCEYVGWAYEGDLTERTRKLFRELPLERRLRLRTV
jgi:hypothetical protein